MLKRIEQGRGQYGSRVEQPAFDLSRIDLNLLVLFEAVFQEGHVGRAAQRLHLTPSAVSHGIGRLRQTFADPLFLKHPKGVMPTACATALAAPIDAVLRQVRYIVGGSEGFDPATSKRRFMIGAPDAMAAVVMPSVLKHLERAAPSIDIGLLDVQPGDVIAALDAHDVDIAFYPLKELPARFTGRALYDEEFVVAVRADHSFGKRVSIANYCAARHLLVSRTADPYGFVDTALEALGYSRHITLTVPNFALALAMIAESDLVGTLPRSLTQLHAQRFGLRVLEPPFALGKFQIRAVTPQVAMQDAGIAWLMDVLAKYGGRGGVRKKSGRTNAR